VDWGVGGETERTEVRIISSLRILKMEMSLVGFE
jgi:hypothetical protein